MMLLYHLTSLSFSTNPLCLSVMSSKIQLNSAFCQFLGSMKIPFMYRKRQKFHGEKTFAAFADF